MNKERLKAIRKAARHDEGYLNRFVTIPASKGFYIEAFCRLDGIIDEMIMRLMTVKFTQAGKIIYMLREENALNSLRVAHLLKKVRVIDKSILTGLQDFKQCRNRLVHTMHGEHHIAIDESGFLNKEGICHNCEGCLKDHLSTIGAGSLEEYAWRVLRRKLRDGVRIYERLQATLVKDVAKRHRK